MRNLTMSLLLLGSLSSWPLLLADESESTKTGEANDTEQDTSVDEAGQSVPPVNGSFTPTERLRWDQEVDYPTDI